MARHPQIKNVSEIEAVSSLYREKFGTFRKRLAAQCGSKQIACSWFELPPGRQAFPHHYHFGNEEAFFVLSGEGEVRMGDEKFPISAGDYIACPVGPESSHSLKNTGVEPLIYLGISTAFGTDIVVYPDSKKFAATGGGDIHKGLQSAPFNKLVYEQPSVGYYAGEDENPDDVGIE